MKFLRITELLLAATIVGQAAAGGKVPRDAPQVFCVRQEPECETYGVKGGPFKKYVPDFERDSAVPDGSALNSAVDEPDNCPLKWKNHEPFDLVTITQAMSTSGPGFWSDTTVSPMQFRLNEDCTFTASTSGDPHFLTFGGKKYDFHGGCDLVLLENPSFNDGLGLNVHVRTQIKSTWSFIEKAVIQIGDHTLEVSGANGGKYWLNGEKEGQIIQTGDASLGDYGVHFRRVNDHQTSNRIDVGNNNAISIETFKSFVRVNVKPKNPLPFTGSAGLLGSFPSGSMVARDGKTLIEDANEFGQEWMVRPTDPILFHDVNESTEFPLKCAMPSEEAEQEARRRLGMGITEEEAAEACARVGEENIEACIFDVMATNDKELAGSY